MMKIGLQIVSEPKALWEDVVHALRDCPAARDIWKLIVHADKMSLFFLGDPLEWFASNFQNHHQICLGDVEWRCQEGIGFVSVGGVMRDQEGRWILAYNWYLGFCFVMEAELWGILDRLTLILEWIYDFLIIQTDSVEAVQAIQEHARKDLELTLIRRIHQLLSRIGHW
ncbi:hypothetical protein Goklo_026920, partial [Gossypium klotzschianum]|nr:hypothetical protein [Gossypium klotzschianum]